MASGLVKATYPTGVVAKFGYDGAGRLTALTHAADGQSLFGASYTLDALGRTTAAREKQDGTTRAISYAYDELSRLTGETTRLTSSQTITNTYRYDLAGNRVAATSTLAHALLATPVISSTSTALRKFARSRGRIEEELVARLE